MAFPVSPGVVVNEVDLTTYVPGVATDIGALAGVYRWGPVGERLLIDSEQTYAKRLGKPTNFNPETWFTGANFLAYSSAMQVVRAANTTGATIVASANVEAGNTFVDVGNTAPLTNGMIVLAASTTGVVLTGSTILVTNSSHVSLSSNSAALATENNVSLTFVANTVALNAIANTGPIASLSSQIVKTEDEFISKEENADFDNDLTWLARWPGELGNSLKVSIVDTAAAYQSNTNLSGGSIYNGSIAYTVDSNTAVLSIAPLANATVFDVNTFNSFVSNTVNSLTVGDYILAGNTEVGEQLLQISVKPELAEIVLESNAAGSVSIQTGNTSLTTTSNGFTAAGIVNGQWIAVFSNTSVWSSLKVASVTNGNTIVLAAPATFSNVTATYASLSTDAYVGNIPTVDRYKRGQNSSRTDLVRYWEYSDAFDRAPGQSTVVRTSGNTAALDEIHIVVVDEDGKFTGVPGTILEKYDALSRATDSTDEDGQPNYYKTVINDTSEYIWAINDRPGAASAPSANVASSTNLSPLSTSLDLGTDGSDENTIALGVVTNAYDKFASVEDVDISLIMVGKSRGGAQGGQLANYLIDNIAEPRQDAVVFVSPERNDVINNVGFEASDIVDFRNTLRSTSYAFLDSGYKYMYDKYNDIYRYVPLNGDIAGLAAKTEQTNDAWWSFAGLNRGKIKNVVKLAYNPRKADRDLMYKNSINAVVTFPGDGTLLYGDKTLLAKPSAFDRINVRRLFIVLEKSIAKASKYSLFEFNDAFTRAQFRNLVIPFLRDVQGRRGIIDFMVVCDSSNNPGSVIDRNEFVGDIYIKAARSINYITLNFIAVPTGVSFTEIVN